MSCSRVRAKLSCHGCAYEWADACEIHNVHLPGEDKRCETCIRNPNPEKFPTEDNFENFQKIFVEMMK